MSPPPTLRSTVVWMGKIPTRIAVVSGVNRASFRIIPHLVELLLVINTINQVTVICSGLSRTTWSNSSIRQRSLHSFSNLTIIRIWPIILIYSSATESILSLSSWRIILTTITIRALTARIIIHKHPPNKVAVKLPLIHTIRLLDGRRQQALTNLMSAKVIIRVEWWEVCCCIRNRNSMQWSIQSARMIRTRIR